MRRYISNYTLLANGEEFINHITTVGDDGKLISILPFDRELGNTIYVPMPLCVAAKETLDHVNEVFLGATSREHFKAMLAQSRIKSPCTGDESMMLALDFNRKQLKQL